MTINQRSWILGVTTVGMCILTVVNERGFRRNVLPSSPHPRFVKQQLIRRLFMAPTAAVWLEAPEGDWLRVEREGSPYFAVLNPPDGRSVEYLPNLIRLGRPGSGRYVPIEEYHLVCGGKPVRTYYAR